MAFDGNAYCNMDNIDDVLAGKDVILSIWDETGANLLAIGGQQGLSINRSAETIDASSKDSDGWGSSKPGMKSWSIDTNGVFKKDDDSHKEMGLAFNNGTKVCLKVVDVRNTKNLYGGTAYITEYSLEAPHEDMMTWSATFAGVGELVDLADIVIPAP